MFIFTGGSLDSRHLAQRLFGIGIGDQAFLDVVLFLDPGVDQASHVAECYSEDERKDVNELHIPV